jgi:hypothetical protein
MKIERLFHEDEKVLWKGKIDDRTYLKQAFLPDSFPAICVWTSLILMIDFAIMAVEGFLGFLFSAMSVLSPILLLPLWIYLVRAISAVHRAEDTVYWLTNYGLYTQRGNEEKGSEEDIEFISYDKIDEVTVFPAKSRTAERVGDLSIIYRVETMDYAARREIRVAQNLTLRKIHAPELVAQMIREMQQKHLEIRENQLAMQVEPQAALQKIQRKKYTVQKQPVQKQAVPAKPKRAYDAVVDPEQAFFGAAQGTLLPRGKAQSFLESAEEKAELLETLPEESVADLQAELFGANAAQQGAFPDPTVNLLPELPEPQDDQGSMFMQQ